MVYLNQPLQTKRIALKNRLVMPPMATGKAESDGGVSQSILDYYDEKSQGGYISLIITEHSCVSLEGRAGANQLSLAEDKVVEGFKRLAETIHANGSKCAAQINHAGSAAPEKTNGIKPAAPSAVPHPWNSKDVPREFSGNDIHNVVAAFGAAARRVKEAGFDAVEIHSAHGYLLHQFFSPITNKRSDEYGGTLQNRFRIHLEIIEEVRSVVGNGFPILLRLGASDYREDGVKIEDSLTAVQAFEKAGVDILDISGGFNAYTVPGSTEQGYFHPLTEAIKKMVSIPVILTGGITEAEAAEELLASGKADLIGVGRAILKDSKWAQKAFES